MSNADVFFLAVALCAGANLMDTIKQTFGSDERLVSRCIKKIRSIVV